MFAVQQQTTDGLEPFSVTLQDVTVENAVGGVAFSNIGGVLSAQNLVFSNSNLMGGVSTGSSVQGNEVNVGMTMVIGASASTSSIMVCNEGMFQHISSAMQLHMYLTFEFSLL